jgi:hypothetical protein
MQIHRNPEADIVAGIPLKPADRKKIINYLRTRNDVQGISKAEFEKYRKGEKQFMPVPHFKAIFNKYGNDFLDLFFES